MLNRKFAMALAAVMVLAVLVGCSSNSGIKAERDKAETRADALRGSLDKVAAALDLPEGSSEADILAALGRATADQLVAIRAELGLADDADSAVIVVAIDALQTAKGALDKVVAALDLPEGSSEADILAALGRATADQLVAIRAELGLADDADSAAIVAAIDALQIEKADLDTEYLHEQAVVAGINAMTGRPLDDADDATEPFSTVSVAFDLKVSAGDLKAADTGAPDAGLSVQAMLTKVDEDEENDTTTTNTAFVYSDRSAPGAEEWTDYYDMGDRTVDGTDPAPGMSAVTGTPQGLDEDGEDTSTADDIVNYRVTFSTTAADIAADGDLFHAATLPSGDRQTFPYSENPDGDADTEDDNRKFMGSYHGVMGEYECTSATCSATSDEDGNLAELTGTWTFTPTSGDSMVMGVDEDSTYVYFGYWLRQTVDEDGDETIGVNHFSGGNGMIPVTDMAAFNCEGIAAGSTCTATYTGKAGGKYAVKTVTSENEVATLHSGQFVADVTLNANFGGNTVPELLWDRIEGEITEFNDAADDQDRINHWEVDLGVASTAIETDDMNVGQTNGGMMGGTWTHTFYSRNAADTETADVSEENMPPGHVAGVFDAHFSDGHAIGAYGASRQ